jgi:hypothetical protein
MATTTLSAVMSFVSSLENTLKESVSGFAGFGSSISADIGAATVDTEMLFNGILTAFSASGNAEVAIVAPIAAAVEGLINGAEAIFGIGKNSVPTTTVAPTPVTPIPVPGSLPDLTDPDAGAI